MSRKVMVIGIGKSGKTALVDAINQVEWILGSLRNMH